jgi:hypothetical protein
MHRKVQINALVELPEEPAIEDAPVEAENPLLA